MMDSNDRWRDRVGLANLDGLGLIGNRTGGAVGLVGLVGYTLGLLTVSDGWDGMGMEMVWMDLGRNGWV